MMLAEKIADLILSFDDIEIPQEVILKAKQHLLDSIGIIIAASKQPENEMVLKVLDTFESEGEIWHALGRQRLSAQNAAFVNATLLHSLEYDDTHLESIIHGSSIVVPTALAICQQTNALNEQLLKSLILGWEIMIRLGLCKKGKFQAAGFHTSAICGPFTASSIICYVEKLTKIQIVNALGIAGSMATGIFEYATAGSDIKKFHAGLAVQNGFKSTKFSKYSVNGPKTVFEGRAGVFNGFTNSAEYNKAVWQDFGEVWHTLDIVFKEYPSCHFNHPYIECIKKMHHKNLIDVEQIKSIQVTAAAEIIPVVLEPLNQKSNVQTSYEAKFSLPFAVSTTLVDGNYSLDSLSNNQISRQEITNLLRKVSYTVDLESDFPKRFSGSIIIELKDGTKIAEKVLDVKGSNGRTFSEVEIEKKFNGNASLALDFAGVTQLRTLIMNLSSQQMCNEIIERIEVFSIH